MDLDGIDKYEGDGDRDTQTRCNVGVDPHPSHAHLYPIRTHTMDRHNSLIHSLSLLLAKYTHYYLATLFVFNNFIIFLT